MGCGDYLFYAGAMIHRLCLAICLFLGAFMPANGEPVIGGARLDQLFSALSLAQEDEWQVIEDEIYALWRHSGSPSMDLLLERGQTALEAGETSAAIEHFTALVDHAPNFAEGWNARATAYFHAGLYGPSLADMGHALTLEPRHFGAMAGLGLILEGAGKFEQALVIYHEILRLHPNMDDVTKAIARIEHALGTLDS